jgi:hypothetical protein
MALTTEDVEIIGRLLDERLARVQAQDRRRRRAWMWFWIALFALSSVASWLVAQRFLRAVDAQISAVDRQFLETKLEYQRQLALDAEMRRERVAAERDAGYQSTQSQGGYEAGLVRTALKAFSQQAALAKKMEALDGSDPEALIAATEEMSGNLTSVLGALTQIMLRNTDPAHTTAQERLLGGGDGEEPGEPGPASGATTVTVAPVDRPVAR